MTNKPSVATTVFGGGGTDKLATVDVYKDSLNPNEVINNFKSVTSKSASKIGELFKTNRMDATDIADLIEINNGVGIDDEKALRRMQNMTGYRYDNASSFAKSISSDAAALVEKLTGYEPSGLFDAVGDFYPLVSGDVTSARELMSIISDITDNEFVNSFVDISAEAGLFGTLMKYAIEMGLPDAVDILMDKIHDEDLRNRVLIENLETAARAGDLGSLYKIKELIGADAMMARCPNIVTLVLGGYRFRDRRKPIDYQGIYTSMIELFTALDPHWDGTTRDGKPIGYLGMWATASENSIELFTRVGSYKDEALIGRSYPSTTLKALARSSFKSVVI